MRSLTLNALTLAALAIAPAVNAMPVEVAQVPEPSTLFMMATGLLAVVLLRKKQ